MKTVSDEFKQALVQPRTIDAKIIIGNDVLTSDDINSIKRQFNSGLFKTIAKMVDIDSNVPIAKDTEINPQFGLYINGAFEYVTLDTYKVKDDPILNKDTKSYQITAYDKIIESMVSYDLTNENITFPCTVKDLITAIYTKLGWDASGIPNDFPNSTSLIEEDVYSNVNMTYRDVLDELCTICCRWIIDIGGIPTMTDTNLLSESEQVEGTNIDITDGEVQPIQELTLKGQTQQDSTILPSEYQQVEYIQSSGTQYIDTGLKGKNAIFIDTDYSITSATTWSSLLGCANGTAGNSVACVIGITKNGSINGGWYWRNTTNEQFDSNNVAQLDLKTNLKASATSFVFKNTNGTKTYSFSEVNSFETTPNMYIFASNKNGTINDYSKIKLYYMKIFDGTTLKREYLPCYRISDNVIGLYDMVENKFYTNAGTGTFTKGSDISIPNPDYPQLINVVTGRQEIDICGKNLFDKNNVRNGYRLGNDGTYYADSGYSATERIVVQPNTTYYRNINLRTSEPICTYDSNDTFIERITTGNAITTPANCKYIRTAVANTNLDTCQLEKGSTSSEYEAYQGISQEINLGKNLLKLDFTTTPTTIAGIPFTYSNNSFTLNGTATGTYSILTLNTNINIISGKKYTLSANVSGTNPKMQLTIKGFNGSNQQLFVLSCNKNNNYVNSVIANFEGTIHHCQFIIEGIENGGTYDLVASDIQFELGDRTSFAPYFEPIELCKISTYQDFIRKGTGEQLFDGLIEQGTFNSSGLNTSDTTRIRTINYINIEENTKYTIKCKNLSSKTIQYSVSYYDKNDYTTARLSYLSWETSNPLTFTTPSGCKYIRFLIAFTNNTTITTSDVCDIQLEKGEQVSTLFEPYGFKDKWYLHKEIGKKILDGSENWITRSGSTTYAYEVTNFFDGNQTTGLCSHFRFISGGASSTQSYECIASANTTKSICIFTNNSSLNTTANLQTWLGTNKPIVYYVLATPTDTEITNQELIGQLESLMNMPLLRGINHITVSTSNEQPTLAITYINEIETINEEYMKDTNVEIQNKVFFNSLVFSRAEESDNIYRKDDTSIEQNGLHELKISDMQTLSLNWRDNFIDEMWNYIKGFNYYAFDINTNGIIYLEPLDRFKLSIFNDEYITSLINSDLTIGGGVNEKIYANEPQESETEYKYADTTDKKVNRTTLIVDKQQGQIEALTSQVNDDTEKISQLIITSDNIQSNVSTINENLTNQLNVLQSSTSLQISAINQTLENGVEKLTNSLVTIDANGINTSRSDETFNTQITNKTFEVKDGSKELAFMGYDSTLNKTVSRIEELEARKITAGVHRTETIYEDGEYWTADYYVGGGI